MNCDISIVQPMPVFIVGSYDENENPDFMNAAWASQCGPKHLTINFAPTRQTLKNIKNTGEFSVAYATKDTLAVSDYFGIASASKTPDKVEKSGVNYVKSDNINAPVCSDYPITVECRVIDIQEIVPERVTVTAEIVNTIVSDDIVDDEGNIDTSAIEFIAYDGVGRNYRVLGDVAGKAFNPENIIK